MLKGSGKMNIRKYALFLRIFLSILLLSVVSVLVLTLTIFYWLSEKTTADINRANETMLRNTGSIFSAYKDFAETYAMELYQNTNIKIIMFSGDKQWNSRYSMAKSQIDSTAAVNTLIHSIYVFDRSGGVALASSKSSVANQSVNQLYSLIKTNVANGPAFWTMKGGTGTGSDVHVMTAFFHENPNENGDLDGAVAVNINLDILEKSIFADKTNANQMLYILDKSGNVILLGPDSDANSIAGQACIKKITAMNSMSGSFVENDRSTEKFNVSFVASSDKEFYFVSKTKYTQSISELLKAGNMLLTVSCLILFAIICLSVLLSWFIYKPVGSMFTNIRKLFNDPSLKTSNMNEIQLTSNALARIADKINALEKDKEINTVIKMITSDNSKKIPADFLAKEGILSSGDKPYCIVVIRIDQFEELCSNNSLESLSFQFSTIRTIAEGTFETKAHVYSYQDANDFAVLILSEKEAGERFDKLDISNSMRSIQEVILKALGIQVTVGISSTSEKTEEFGSKFREAVQYTNYRILLGTGSLVGADTISRLDKSDISENLIEAVADATRMGSEAGFLTALDRLLSECSGHTYEKSAKALVRLAIAMNQIPNAVIRSEKELLSSNYLDIHREISALRGCTELKGWFLALFKNTSKFIHDINSRKIFDVMNEVVEYIDKDYSNPQLSVNSMAEMFSISSSYFSRIFNDFFGCSFPDYISNIRLERAKELLRKNPGMEINEVAKQVGYSINYFSIAFKKKYGISPSKCRANQGEKQ